MESSTETISIPVTVINRGNGPDKVAITAGTLRDGRYPFLTLDPYP